MIPLGVLGQHDPGLVGIGANGGAIRPLVVMRLALSISKLIMPCRAAAGRPLAIEFRIAPLNYGWIAFSICARRHRN